MTTTRRLSRRRRAQQREIARGSPVSPFSKPPQPPWVHPVGGWSAQLTRGFHRPGAQTGPNRVRHGGPFKEVRIDVRESPRRVREDKVPEILDRQEAVFYHLVGLL